MAKESLVTRTIKTTKVDVLVVQLSTNSTSTVVISIPGVFKSSEKLLKVVRKKVDTDELKAVSIIKAETVSALYGMTESDFLAGAKVLPPRKIYNNYNAKKED